MLGKNEGRRKKGTTEDEMVGWPHQLKGHGFGWTPGDPGWGQRIAFLRGDGAALVQSSF